MELFLVKCLLLSFIFSLQIHGQYGCFHEERLALLDIKAFVLSNGDDVDELLPSWKHDTSDCCGWDRVWCNSTNGHVIKLSLYDIRQIPYYYYGEMGIWWYLNISLFQPFKEIRSLNLSYNGIAEFIDNKCFESLSSLKKLETLDLSYNSLNESIMPSLIGLPSLKNLILEGNYFGSFPTQDLSRFKSLEMLDLSYNSIFFPPVIDATMRTQRSFLNLSNLNSLKYLDLSYNPWRGLLFIPEYSNLSNLEVLNLRGIAMRGTWRIKDLTAFSNLEVLDLSANLFDGSILPGLCRLNRLQEIDLSDNIFEGILPPCLHNLTTLRVLDLSDNNFKGNISSSVIAGLTSLEYIDLSRNHFEGLLSFSSFANLSKLEVVLFTSDNDKFEIETEDSGWTPQFQLKALALQNCNLNKHNRKIPQFLIHQRQLKLVDLSHNRMEGKFPDWLLVNNARLQSLILRNNSLMGQFYLPLNPLMKVIHVDVSNNHIEGQLQENFGKLFWNLEYLNFSKNSFEGTLPSSICDMRNLKYLDLSSNNFLGEAGFIARCTNLEVIDFSNNYFFGRVFSTHYNWSALLVLRLSNNKFTGSLSDIKFNSFFLSLFDISNNYISGKIPKWIGNATWISVLDMQNNYLEGGLQCEPFSASYVDLSHNFLSGSVPSCSNTHDLQHIYLQENSFTGSFPKAFLNSSILLALNIRNNRLSGNIPEMIGSLSRLRILLLGGNHFSGSIPKQLCQLQSLSLMDFSSNSFSGSIPRCFNNVTFGKMSFKQSIAEISIFLPALTEISVYPNKEYFGGEKNVMNGTSSLRVEIEFVTKNRSNSYIGDILNFMSGLDLSCNNLTGEIPVELGNLSWIHALNLSHNQLTGPIPRTFAKLAQVESLDLSHNSLSGEIPSELIDLNFLSDFTVAYNNLSGKIPDKGQFSTFDCSSYEGNPFLSEPPSMKNCSGNNELPLSPIALPHEADEKWYEIDLIVFFASFSVSFMVFFFGVVTILYVNPYWRRRLFYHSEKIMFMCYYFIYDTVIKLQARLYH